MGVQSIIKQTPLYKPLRATYRTFLRLRANACMYAKLRKFIRINKAANKKPENKPHVAFVLFDRDQIMLSYPYLYALAVGFLDNGFNVLFTYDYTIWKGISPYAVSLFSTTGIVFTSPAGVKRVVAECIFTDDLAQCKKLGLGSGGRCITISSDVLKRNVDGEKELIMPFFMHPEIYFNHRKGVEKAESSIRNCKIFWSGNAHPEAYNSSIFREFFGMLSRTGILQAVRENLSQDELLINPQEDIFNNKQYINKLLLMEWFWTQENSSNMAFRIPQHQWLRTLGKADFFLGCPGVSIPLCHNIIEAMSQGCIPLTNAGNYFCPTLEHGRNCIAFTGKDDLLKQIRIVLNMEAGEILKLRTGVNEYYNTYLIPSVFAKEILTRGNVKKVFFYATGISMQKYRERGAGSLEQDR